MSDAYAQVQEVAMVAVRCAAGVCRTVQQRLVSADTLEKKDRSPVTVADFASQAVVCAHLAKHFPLDVMIAEEDSKELRQLDQAVIRKAVVEQVSNGMGCSVNDEQVLDWIDRGGAVPTGSVSPSRFWTLDPIDGTKGFLRGGQYAVALALIEDGRVVLGLLGCPNLLVDGKPGALFVAGQDSGAYVAPLWDDQAAVQAIRVSDVADPAQARFCESVESGHSSHSDAAKIAQKLGITGESVRMDSQAKYATVARGEASIYLRLPTRADYVEKIWDHAAGWMVITEAGGRVTDIAGKPLQFTHGRTLQANRGIIATNGSIHDAVVGAVGQVLS